MPPAARRVSLLLLPRDPDAPPDRVRALADALRGAGYLSGDGPGPRPLVDGGFARARVEDFDATRFASSGQGGFRVTCPVDGTNVVARFVPVLEAWRAGGPRSLACACGGTHDLADLAYAPEAGFARGWVVLADVASAELTPEADAFVDGALGGVRVVARRG